MDLTQKAELLRTSIIGQFISRTEIEGKKRGVDFGISLSTKVECGSAWFTFSKGGEQHSFNIPIPYEENNVLLLEQNEVRRAVCPYLIREEDLILDYFSIMQRILCSDPTGIISDSLVKRAPFIQQIVYSFNNGNTSVIMYNLQRAINEVVNKMPLHETDLNSWVMNRRLIIIDPEFNKLRGPEDRLNYQVEKSKAYFDRGWTPIGLADGNLADKNYTLTYDVRHLTPFGMRYHNPQRNLYSTLGMKGDELPKVRSQSMQDLMDQGITRKGWNLFTLFADIPDVFEDQIMVDKCHQDKYVTYEKRYQCFGMLRVKEKQIVRKGQTLSISDEGTAKRFDIDCDRAKVKKIGKATMNVGGTITEVSNVVIEYRRYLRDGVKLTNLHGNKGVIRMKDLGYMVHPATGETRKIDVIVSGKSIKKRKNFGQLLEALLNNVKPEEEKPLVLADDYQVPMETVGKSLEAMGMPSDGTWACESYVGPLTGICGEVFWGVIASVENALWGKGATIRRNTRDLRVAGLKFSHVELRSLQTRFGKDNPISAEILSYVQGGDDLHEYFKMLKSKRAEVPKDAPVHHAKDLAFVNQSSGTIVDKSIIEGTIVDEKFEPDGFVIQLPVSYQVMTDEKGEAEYEGAVNAGSNVPGNVENVYTFDKIYIPKSRMRRCWQHDNGKLGLNEIGVLVNNIVIMSHRYAADPQNIITIRMLYQIIYSYFARVSKMLGSKRGEIAQLGMSVRYPFSSKAVATLSNRLPDNTIEIHEDMAATLHVTNGDVVLVERFPCLGFMSVRPQKIRVTNDEMCRYTIRVSGNCLCSLGLDFDGDVIYLASFHTHDARELLRKEWDNPNASCYKVIQGLNLKAGVPAVDNLSLDDYNVEAFGDLDIETHAVLVNRATGVKSHTGPVIALAYNIMRILENSKVKDDQEVNVAIEVFLDRVGNTVFKQKHGILSLHSIVTDAICTGNVEMLVKHGFNRETSTVICDIIREKAASIGVYNLVEYHNKAKRFGWSSVVNRIVREQNKIYFASRSNMEGCHLLSHLESPAVDIPSKILKSILSGKAEGVRTVLEDYLEEDQLSQIHDVDKRGACKILMDYVEKMLMPTDGHILTEEAHKNIVDSNNRLSSYRKHLKARKVMLDSYNNISARRRLCQQSGSRKVSSSKQACGLSSINLLRTRVLHQKALHR